MSEKTYLLYEEGEFVKSFPSLDQAQRYAEIVDYAKHIVNAYECDADYFDADHGITWEISPGGNTYRPADCESYVRWEIAPPGLVACFASPDSDSKVWYAPAESYEVVKKAMEIFGEGGVGHRSTLSLPPNVRKAIEEYSSPHGPLSMGSFSDKETLEGVIGYIGFTEEELENEEFDDSIP